MTKKKYILYACLLIVFLVVIFFVIVPIFRELTAPEYDSGLGSAQWEIRHALNEYYKENGRYPAKLIDLPNLVFQGEAFSCLEVSDSSEILKYFTYKATDETYELDIDYSGAIEPRLEKEFGEKGQVVVWAFYKNGKLYDKHFSTGVDPNIKGKYLEKNFIPQTINDSNANIIPQKEYK